MHCVCRHKNSSDSAYEESASAALVLRIVDHKQPEQPAQAVKSRSAARLQAFARLSGVLREAAPLHASAPLAAQKRARPGQPETQAGLNSKRGYHFYM